MTTLPESLVEAIKVLVKSHQDFVHEVEELQALGLAMQAHIDRLVAHQQQRLADIHLADRTPVSLPRAIVPQNGDGRAQEA